MHKENKSPEKSLKQCKENSFNEKQKCKFCTSIFENAEDYLTHIETAHRNNKNNSFMCSVCAKQYKTKNELTQHMNSKCGTIKQFKCKICNQELMSAGSLYNHMLRHNGVRSYMCRFCAKLFFTAGQLKVHERIHTQDKAYVCEVCNKGFCHRQSLITHSTLHTGIKPYQCENCGNSFSCVGNLMKHRRTHADTCGLIPLTTHKVEHPSTKIKVKINTPPNTRLKAKEKDDEVQKELELLKTELCKKETEISADNETVTATDTNNSKHDPMTDENGEQVKSEQDSEDDNRILSKEETSDEQNVSASCDEDEKKVKRRKRTKKKRKKDPKYEDLLLKFTAETNFDKDGYSDCKYCSKRYMNIRWFYKHVKDHENNISAETEPKPGISLYKCSCCRMSFHTKEENAMHQQTKHADILSCYECDKIFANRDSLRSHHKVFHQGFERKTYSYICDKCGKQFKQKLYLKAHEERNCDKDLCYECSICNKQFSSIYTRNNHMRIHDPEKKLVCKFCGKSFHWKGQLKIHERSHTGEKPFACLYCPKAFAHRESLITHSSIHTGIKPHLCEGCGSRFSCIGNLIKHKRGHSSECGSWTYKTEKLPKEEMAF